MEELRSGAPPITGVETAITAVVGATPAGPVNEPTPVRSLAEFRDRFDAGPPRCPVSMAVHLYFANGGSEAVVVRTAPERGNGRRRMTAASAIGRKTEGTGIHALDRTRHAFGLLLTPDAARLGARAAAQAVLAVQEFCEPRRVFALAEMPAGTGAGASAIRNAVAWSRSIGALDRSNLAAYFPRIDVADPADAGASSRVSATGAIAGVYARTDRESGVWKAPAGLDARLQGCTGLEHDPGDRDTEALRSASVNPLRLFDGRGIVPWGARCFASPGNDDPSRYVPVRRTALYIEESLRRGLGWTVFEPNSDALWAQIRLSVTSFMNQLFRSGAFQGASSREGYFVKCSRETTTEADIANGRCNLVVGFAPLRPAEFVVLPIALEAGDTR